MSASAVISWVDPTTLDPQLSKFYSRLGQRFAQPDLDPQLCSALNNIFAAANKRLDQFHHLLQCSDFAFETFLKDPSILLKLLRDDTLDQTYTTEQFLAILTQVFEDDTHCDTHLRKTRRFAMCHLLWRDFNRLANLDQTTNELSALASASLQLALAYHYKNLEEKHGSPRNKAGVKQPMLILGMGKLGASELNLSSDIDLIFTYPENGETDGAKPISNQEFFIEVGKRVIRSLDANTADGFVFRVDMRLRPYGQSGALVSNFDALEEYYQSQGREWERYAMVKASVVAANRECCPEQYPQYLDELMDILRSFTYRKYIDFSAIDALRNLKQMIVQEVKRRGLTSDIKLGPGGIREIEFITQVFQLIRGGRDQELQDNRLCTVLPLLENYSCLPPGKAQGLIEAYTFLRNCEHGIQGYADKQTQRLPRTEEEQHALVKVMGFDAWESFISALDQHRTFVSEEFASVIAEPEETTTSPNVPNPWVALWQGRQKESANLSQLENAGFDDAAQCMKRIEDLREYANSVRLHSNSRERLDKFMPLLLSLLEDNGSPALGLERIAKLVKAIVRRSAYILLLIENPGALTQLIKLTTASPWMAEQLALHPALLDELIDPRTLFHPPDKEELKEELRRATLRMSPDDLEEQMEALRYFRSAHALRVGASELTNSLPLMKVSDYLSWMAEVILQYVLQLCWDEMTRKYGYPDGQERAQPPFIIIGYGKLGGIELGHGSDLDLVFIHNCDINGSTNGPKSIENQRFFMQLGQKIIHILNTNTPSGRLYEVDMRLRPSGKSGMLVSSLNGFAKYQRDTAWTWEHQALVRARVVAGDADITTQFEDIRREILCRERDEANLRKEVEEMRIKMRDHLGSGKKHHGKSVFDIKHDAGGIVDIEFMVQYGVLAWSHADPSLVTFTDNIRILECFLHSGKLEAQEVDQLTEAYKAYRSLGHRLTLQQEAAIVDEEQFESERSTVTRIWNRLITPEKP